MEVEKILYRFHEKVVSPLGWDGTTWVLDAEGNPVRGAPARCFPARACRVCVLLLLALVAVFGGALASLHATYVGHPGCLAPTLLGVLPYLPPRYDWYQGEAPLQALQRRLLNLSDDAIPPRPMTLDGYFGPYDVFRLRFAVPEDAEEGAGYVPAPTPGPAGVVARARLDAPSAWGGGSVAWARLDAPSAWGGGRAAWINPLPLPLDLGESTRDVPVAVPWWLPALTMGVGTANASSDASGGGGVIGPNSTALARAAFVPHLLVSRSSNGLQMDNRDRPHLGIWTWNVTVPAVCPGGARTLPKRKAKSSKDKASASDDGKGGGSSTYRSPWRRALQGTPATAAPPVPVVPAYDAPGAAGVALGPGSGLARWALNTWVVSPETPLLNAAQWTWPFAGGAALDPYTGEGWGWEPVAATDTPAAARRLAAENEAADDWSPSAAVAPGASFLETYYPALAAAIAAGDWPYTSLIGAGGWPSAAGRTAAGNASDAAAAAAKTDGDDEDAAAPFAPAYAAVAFSRGGDALLGLVAWFLASSTAALMVRSMVTSGSVLLLPMFGALTGEAEWACPCCWGCGVCPRRGRRLRRGLHARQSDCMEALYDGVLLWLRPLVLPLWAALQRHAPRVAAALVWVWLRTPCGPGTSPRRRGGAGAGAAAASGSAAGASGPAGGYISATATGGGGGGGFARLDEEDDEEEGEGAALQQQSAVQPQVANPLRGGGGGGAAAGAEPERVRQRRRPGADAGDAVIAVAGGAAAAAPAPRQPLRVTLTAARSRLRERLGLPPPPGVAGMMLHPSTAVRLAPPMWLEAAQAFPWSGRELVVLEQQAQADYESTLLAEADAVEAELAAGEFGDIDPATFDPTPPPPPRPPVPPRGDGEAGAPPPPPPPPEPGAPPPAPPPAHPFVDPFADTPEPPSFTGTLLTLVDARARVSVARRWLPRLRAAVWAHVWAAASAFIAYQCTSLVLPALVWGGKSSPEGWGSSAWSLLLLAEYFSVMFLRSRRGMSIFPHAIAVIFLGLHMYHTSTPYPLSTLALGVANLLLLLAMVATLLHAEAPALEGGEVSGDKPRAVMCASIVPGAPWEVPGVHTLFLGLNHTPTTEAERPGAFLQGAAAAPAAPGGPPGPPPPEAAGPPAVVVAVPPA